MPGADLVRRARRLLRQRGLRRAIEIPLREARFRMAHPALGRRQTGRGGAGRSGDGHRDEHSRISVVEDALAMVPDQARSGAFVDIGCATGRVLHIAARYSFTRVLGIEISPDLVATARRHLSDPRVEVIQADASQWRVPDDVTVAYLFNPFGPVTTTAVLQSMAASQERAPRPIVICDISGVHDELFAAAGFTRIAEAPHISIWRR